MFRSLILRPRSLFLFALALIFAMASYGFAAANTFSGPNTAGDGSSAVSGYAISNIHYILNSSNPGNVDTVTFTTVPAISTAAPVGTVKVQIAQGASNTWHNCTISASVTCDLTKDLSNAAASVTAAGISSLRVVAAQ